MIIFYDFSKEVVFFQLYQISPNSRETRRLKVAALDVDTWHGFLFSTYPNYLETQLTRTPIKSYYIIYTNEVKKLYPEKKKKSTQVKKTHSISNFHDNVK